MNVFHPFPMWAFYDFCIKSSPTTSPDLYENNKAWLLVFSSCPHHNAVVQSFVHDKGPWPQALTK
jgi:hypothetical protein